MKRTPLWIGILALWLGGSAVGAWFALTSDDAPVQRTKPAVGKVDAQRPEAGDPLKNQNTPPHHAVLPFEQPEESTTSAKDANEAEETADKATRQSETKPERESTIGEYGKTVKPEATQIHDLHVRNGGTVQLPAGEVSIDGDLTFEQGGILGANTTTLILDGTNQTISGDAKAAKIVMRGGTKRIRGSLGTISSANAEPGQAQLYVEPGTTLIIEAGGKWTTPNAYGFQIAGDLVIDGGEFHCRFTNGNGTDRGEMSWLPGSTLTIYSGKFVGNGDADFSGATITIHDGALEINDDIWDSGTALNIYGGSMRNSTGGGMFSLNGDVNVRDGKLQVYQSSSRGLRIINEASVYCTGGEVSINGRGATGDNSGIVLSNSATLPNLVINVSTRIHKSSDPGAFLSVSGDLKIAKGQRFEAKGFNVIASFLQTDDQGEFIP